MQCAHTSLSLLLFWGCRGQDLTNFKFSGLYMDEYDGISLFGMVSAGVRKRDQTGKPKRKAIIRNKDPLIDPVGALALYLAGWNHHDGRAKERCLSSMIKQGDTRWVGYHVFAPVTSPSEATAPSHPKGYQGVCPSD